LDAILFKKVTDPATGKLVPAFHWHIRRITAIRHWRMPPGDEGPPYQFVSIRRNEVTGKIPPANLKAWMKDPAEFEPYLVDSAGRDSAAGANRCQRNTLALRNVAYIIDASIDMPTPSETDPPVKYREMFLRRIEKGQCFHRPCLGCREFACDFAPLDGTEQPLAWDEDLGLMLYDIRYQGDGTNVPGFFDAKIRGGVLHCDTAEPAPWGGPPVIVVGWPAADSAQPAEAQT